MTIELRQSRSQRLADAILRDREERAARKPTSVNKSKPPGSDFDPFAVTCWRVIAPKDGKRGYLPKTSMRVAPTAWFINCQYCRREFESKGWGYCCECMELPAEERRGGASVVSDRSCRHCGNGIPKRRRADAKYCSNTCAKAAENARGYRGNAQPKFRGDTREIHQQNQSGFSALIGPSDFPINVIGGYRFPLAKRLTESPPLVPDVLSDMVVPKRVDA
jgi:hypothetical protein